ncbi:MAG: imelysin family protein, partial [Solirubrobacteraceae bacterium]
VAAAREFDKTAGELAKAAEAWQPTLQDALTALVVMTPTMSEYFEAWKSSRFVAGEKASEKAFVVASRLQDITDILSGLVLVYDNVQPSIAEADPAQARQTANDLKALRDFAARLRDQERDGKRFDAQDADTLGREAQTRAEAIAGQISQAAGRLDIELTT